MQLCPQAQTLQERLDRSAGEKGARGKRPHGDAAIDHQHGAYGNHRHHGDAGEHGPETLCNTAKLDCAVGGRCPGLEQPLISALYLGFHRHAFDGRYPVESLHNETVTTVVKGPSIIQNFAQGASAKCRNHNQNGKERDRNIDERPANNGNQCQKNSDKGKIKHQQP